MKHFPIFLAVAGKRIVVSGGGEAAIAKLRLLMKTEAQDHRFRTKRQRRHPPPRGRKKLTLINRAMDKRRRHLRSPFLWRQ